MSKVITIILLSFLLFSVSCGKQQQESLVPEDKLIKILADIHIAEAAIQGLHGEQKDSIAEVYYDQIEKIHGIERSLIDSTVILMRKDPTFIATTYTKVLEELSKREAESK